MARHLFIAFIVLSLGLNIELKAQPGHMTGPQIWEKIFVPALLDKFRRDNHSISKVETILKDMGGSIVLDHGGTRTADPQVYAFLTRIGNALGLRIRDHYKFPSKHLEAIDMQIPGTNGFKWFSSLIRYDNLSPEVAKIVEMDNVTSRPHLSERAIDLLEKLEESKSLTQEEAQEFVHEIVNNYFKRHGRPLGKDALQAVAKESLETANALLLGPDFNHLAISLNNLNIPTWYGLEVIEVLTQKLKEAKFVMLPNIQGERGGKLRQTSILADENKFPILQEGGITSSISYPSKYVEFIQRGPDLDDKGRMQFTGGKVSLFLGFLRDNAEALYESTNPKP